MEKLFMLTTMSKQKIKISKRQEIALRQAEVNKLVNLNGTTINTSTIDCIMPLNEYYKINPNERPEREEHKQIKIPVKQEITQARRINALKSMGKGFEGNFKGRQIPLPAKGIYEKLLINLKRAENGEEVSILPSAVMR
jgi:hypothetical protein